MTWIVCICHDVDAVECLKRFLVNVRRMREGGRAASVAAVQMQHGLKKEKKNCVKLSGRRQSFEVVL